MARLDLRGQTMENAKQAMQRMLRNYGSLALLVVLALPIGGAIGAVDALFGRGLLAIGAVRTAYFDWLIPFLPLAGLCIAAGYRRFGGTSSRGMGLVFAVGHGAEREIPIRLIPLVIGSTWLTHLFGGSAGREGVAVQIGATISHWVGRRLAQPFDQDVFLVTGMAAGFAGLFQTPLASALFGMELLVAGELRYQALLPALAASWAASTVSHALGLEKFTVSVTALPLLDPLQICRLAGLGVLFGMAGLLFSVCLNRGKAAAARLLPNPLLRAGLLGSVLSVLIWSLGHGRYAGLGTNLIAESFCDAKILPWDWILKLVLTVLTLAAGYQGGEVTPLFAIGASLGALLAAPLHLPLALAAALGYAAVFGSATNTLLAPILIGCEVFGAQNLPAFVVVCAVAYAVNGNRSIYALQKNRWHTVWFRSPASRA